MVLPIASAAGGQISLRVARKQGCDQWRGQQEEQQNPSNAPHRNHPRFSRVYHTTWFSLLELAQRSIEGMIEQFLQFATLPCTSTTFPVMFSRNSYSMTRKTAGRRFFFSVAIGQRPSDADCQRARRRSTGTLMLCWTRVAVVPRNRSARNRWPCVLMATKSHPLFSTHLMIWSAGSP